MMSKREGQGWGEKMLGSVFFALLLLLSMAAQAADNAECLTCHKNSRLSKGKKDGSLLSLYVNEEAFKKSVHGAAGMGCTDCHQEAKPNVHPAEGFAEVGCVSCHPDSAEAYKKTTHGMVLESGVERAPRCVDCHTSHYLRKINDPESPVRASRLPGVCVQCHMEAKPPSGFWAALASFRLQGHPKTDLNERLDTQGCSNCHPGNTGHPQKPEGVASCVKGHDPSVPTPVLMSPVHFKISFREQPVPYILRFFYGAGLGLIILGGIGFFSCRAYRHRKDEKGSAPPPGEAGEGKKS